MCRECVGHGLELALASDGGGRGADRCGSQGCRRPEPAAEVLQAEWVGPVGRPLALRHVVRGRDVGPLGEGLLAELALPS